ncbi:MAG: class II aldolase/adducin family protein [Alphaproteobacteria bacterium]
MPTALAAVSSRDATWSDAEWAMRVDLAAAFRLADRYGFSDFIWNHITARVPGESERFLINPFGLRYDEITASSLVKVDVDGNVIGGGSTNYTGFVIHSSIHAARPDVACVMHTHARGGCAVGCLEEGLLPFIQDSLAFGDKVAYHDYEGLGVDLGERQRIARNLGDAACLFLRNHGLITVGATVGEAFVRMVYLERACRVQMDILATGRPYRTVSAAMRAKAAAQYGDYPHGKHEWPALIRLLDQKDPSYKT